MQEDDNGGDDVGDRDEPGRAMNASACRAISAFRSCISETTRTSPTDSPVNCRFECRSWSYYREMSNRGRERELTFSCINVFGITLRINGSKVSVSSQG